MHRSLVLATLWLVACRDTPAEGSGGPADPEGREAGDGVPKIVPNGPDSDEVGVEGPADPEGREAGDGVPKVVPNGPDSDAGGVEGPPNIPACKHQASLSAMNGEGGPAQHFLYAATWVGDRLVVAARDKQVVELAEYRPTTNDWRALTSETFADLDDVLPSTRLSRSFYVTDFDTGSGKQVAIHEFGTGRWSRLPAELKPAGQFRSYLFGGALVLVPAPEDSCAYSDWGRAFVIDLATSTRHELDSPPVGDLWRPGEMVEAGDRMVLWGGARTAKVVDTPDCEQPNQVETNEGWLLDAAARTWQPIPAGPAAGEVSISVVVGDALVLVSGSEVWRLDLPTRTWSKLGTAMFAERTAVSKPEFASLLADNVAGRAVFMKVRTSGTEGIIVDPDGSVRVIERGFGAKGATETLAIDDRLLVLPRQPAESERAAYVLDTRDAKWCELAWPVPDSMWRDTGSRYFRGAFVDGGRGYLWAPDGAERDASGREEGIVVELPAW